MLAGALIHRIRSFPEEAINDLFDALEAIERKYDLLEPVSEEDRRAIEEGLASLDRGEAIPMEDLEIFKHLKDYDHDSVGREDLADAVSRVKKLSGEQQRDVADVILALLNEYRFDTTSTANES